MARAPDCLASHACVLVSNPAVPVWETQCYESDRPYAA